jgi:hypothetical protein
MSLLNPAKLRSEVEAREARKIKVFEHILDICYNKIMITNQQSDDCCCIFACPSVVFGLPLFNLMDCIRHIMIKLVEKGFEVHLAIPNNIFISWKKDSNPDYSRQIYQLALPAPPSSLDSNKYKRLESGNNSIGSSEFKLFSNRHIKKEKDKNYRPVEDYRQTIGAGNGISGYNLDDIDVFHSKLNELLS